MQINSLAFRTLPTSPIVMDVPPDRLRWSIGRDDGSKTGRKDCKPHPRADAINLDPVVRWSLEARRSKADVDRFYLLRRSKVL